MKKSLGVNPYLFPMPVLMIATYNEHNKVNVMNAAWGGMYAENMVLLNLDENHKTSQNIKNKGLLPSALLIPNISKRPTSSELHREIKCHRI